MEVSDCLVITKNELIKQIADREDINVATVRNVFTSAEDIIFAYLSSITPSENLIIKLLNGMSIERRYVDEKNYSRGMFENITCPEHVIVKANSSKYYNKKINDAIWVNKSKKKEK